MKRTITVLLGGFAVLIFLDFKSQTASRQDFEDRHQRMSNVVDAETATLPALFGASKTGQLFSINLTTGAGTFIGNIPVGADLGFTGTTEIVFNNTTRRAFSQFGDGDFGGQEFNINTGAAIGNPVSNGGAYQGLEWVGSTLYGTAIFGSGGPSQLRTLDPFTGTSTLIG